MLFGSADFTGLHAQGDIFDEIYYFVNDDIVSKLDFEDQKELFEKTQASIGDQDPNVFVMSNLIFNRLIFENLDLRGKLVSEEEVEKEVEKLMRQQRINSLLIFKDALARNGIDYETFFDNLERSLNQRVYFSDLDRTTLPTESEVEQYYQKNQNRYLIEEPLMDLSLIRINLSNSAGFSLRRRLQAQLQGIRDRIVNERIPFERALDEFNDLRNNIVTRRLGLIDLGELGLTSADRNRLQRLGRGDVSEILSNAEGLNIFLVNSKVSNGKLPQHIAKQKARQELILSKRQEEITEKITTLFQIAYLRNNNPLFDSLAKSIDN